MTRSISLMRLFFVGVFGLATLIKIQLINVDFEHIENIDFMLASWNSCLIE